jgi:hypothetical protein
VDDKGMLLVSIAPGAGSQAMAGQGALLQLDVEALCAGDSAFTLDPGNVHLVAADGRGLMLQMGQSHLTVKQ